MKLHYDLPGDNFAVAGEASSAVKKTLNQLGISPKTVKKTAIALYEAEINAIIHGGGGEINVDIGNEKICIRITDYGPGIADVDRAMQEGFSTASDKIRELGFGAGMGLPNINRYTDGMRIDTKVGEGTTLTLTFLI